MMNIAQKLKENTDKKYKEFSQSLLPNVNNILGVRIPILRKIAKEIYKNKNLEFLQKQPTSHEESLLQAMVIGLTKNITLIEPFIHKITNWAICDTFCADLKITKTHKKEVYKIIKKYIKSKKEYELRFSLVMLLNYYVEEDYLTDIFKYLNTFKSKDYYAQMAAAWLICVCCTKFPLQTIEFLKTTNINEFTYKKAIQKIQDAYKIDKNIKNICKSMAK